MGSYMFWSDESQRPSYLEQLIRWDCLVSNNGILYVLIRWDCLVSNNGILLYTDQMRPSCLQQWDLMCTDQMRLSCLVHPGVRDKRQVSEIDLSQPRHETAFWWRHNGPVMSQLTDRIKWPNYPVELIGIYVHINTHNKESLAQRCRRSTNVQLCLIFLYISIWFES